MILASSDPPSNRVFVVSGPAEVLAAGSVISFAGSPVTVEYGREAERFKINFRFVEDPGRAKPRVKARKVDTHILEIRLTNFTSSAGNGSTKPVKIGGVDGWSLYLHYWVSALPASKDKILQFTVYRVLQDIFEADPPVHSQANGIFVEKDAFEQAMVTKRARRVSARDR
jgi:hypothetical protein